VVGGWRCEHELDVKTQNATKRSSLGPHPHAWDARNKAEKVKQVSVIQAPDECPKRAFIHLLDVHRQIYRESPPGK